MRAGAVSVLAVLWVSGPSCLGLHRAAPSRFTIEELRTTTFPRRISEDIDADPCKGSKTDGDVVLPNMEYQIQLDRQKRSDRRALLLITKNGSYVSVNNTSNVIDDEIMANIVNLDSNDVENSVRVVSSGNAVTESDSRNACVSCSHECRGKKYRKKCHHRLRLDRRRKKYRKRRKHRRRKGGKRRDHRWKKDRIRGRKKARRSRKWRRKQIDWRHPIETSENRRRTDDKIVQLPAGEPLSRRKRAATARLDRVWDHGVIPYVIEDDFSAENRALFRRAMRHWENSTCIKFVEREPALHPHWVVFAVRQCGCCSFVGRRGNGEQAISIGKHCDKFGIVVHELGHVVGFWHEHTRPDRDNHVEIFTENIMDGQGFNFNKMTSEDVNSRGLPYDYESIMHYARNTFSKNSYLDTILPRARPGVVMPEIGQRVKLSKGDIAQTMKMYNCSVCGQTLQFSNATFSSPPPALRPNAGHSCEWRITATHGERINLNISTLDIHSSQDCTSDYLEVRDGYWHLSPLIGRYCGSGSVPELIVSTGPRLLVTYRVTEQSGERHGFIANYTAVCGGNLKMSHGVIESPNYPDYYRPSKDCIWTIQVEDGHKVAFEFTAFEVENHDNCFYDFVEVRNGPTADSPLIGKYCGYHLPPTFTSSGNHLWVRFVSDGSVNKPGFAANFMTELDECSGDAHGCEHTCVNTRGSYKCACRIGYELHSDGKRCEAACGGTIELENGTLTSPSFPDLYPRNKRCIWELIAPPRHRITLNMTHFDLEGSNVSHQDCDYDRLEIYSVMTGDELRTHGTFCGTAIPPAITSETNKLRVTFSSDNSVERTGFAGVFFTDKDECAQDNGGCHHRCVNTVGSYMCVCDNGFTLHENGHDCKEGGCKHEILAPFGEVSSPNYPDFYPGKKDCIWHFQTTPGHRIKLIFNEFDLEHHQECTYDHISVYDGASTEAVLLGNFCGAKAPHPITASRNEMYMTFTSDGSVQRKGFIGTHSTVCGGYLYAQWETQYLYSHAKYGDEGYDNKEECDWTLEAPVGYNVRLRFLEFELEAEQDCGYDLVKVFDGFDETSSVPKKYCGNQIPPPMVSTNGVLRVLFSSDDTINTKGFSASYEIIDSNHIEDLEKNKLLMKQGDAIKE